MTVLMMFAALVSVAWSWLPGPWLILILVVVIAGSAIRRLMRRFFMETGEMLDGGERGRADAGRPHVVYKLTRTDVAGPAQRIAQCGAPGRDLVPARKHGWVTAHQHFGDLDRNAVVDVLGSRPAAENESTSYQVYWIKRTVQALEDANRAGAGEPRFVRLAHRGGVSSA